MAESVNLYQTKDQIFQCNLNALSLKLPSNWNVTPLIFEGGGRYSFAAYFAPPMQLLRCGPCCMSQYQLRIHSEFNTTKLPEEDSHIYRNIILVGWWTRDLPKLSHFSWLGIDVTSFFSCFWASPNSSTTTQSTLGTFRDIAITTILATTGPSVTQIA